jgi:hypothetical protein
MRAHLQVMSPRSTCGLQCRMLCIGECVVLINRYIHSRAVASFGIVCNAFSEALRQVMDDWELFLCSLEHNLQRSDAPVHALWCHLQPSIPLLHFTACVPLALLLHAPPC